MSPLLTVAEVVEILHISRSTLYEQMDAGLLPYVKLGRARRIEREALEQYIAANRKGGWAIEKPQG